VTDTHLSALAVEAITVASLKSGVPQRSVFRPSATESAHRDARSQAMDHMKNEGASVDEISRVFAVSEKTVRNAITKARK